MPLLSQGASPRSTSYNVLGQMTFTHAHMDAHTQTHTHTRANNTHAHDHTNAIRFRLRYSVFDDCYYLHWDSAVCPPLAKITGLTNGVHFISGVTRYTDDSSGQVRSHSNNQPSTMYIAMDLFGQ